MKIVLALSAVLLCVPSAVALAADSSKPLRTLVYDIQYDWFTTRDERTSGFTGSEGGPSVMPAGSAHAKTDMQSSDSGKLTLDVIAASADGLVIDAAFAGKKNPQPAIRVVVYPDGRLAYDPQKQLSPEASALLPLFAAGFVANHDIVPGTSWTLSALKPNNGTTTYKVDDLDGELAKLTITSSLRTSGTDAMLQDSDATATYDITKLDPISYDLSTRVKRQVSQDIDENSRSHLIAKLTSDTFGSK